jgi:hypothetical protein
MHKLLIAAALLSGCDYLSSPRPCECQQVLNIEPYGMTRADIVWTCVDGQSRETTLHWSNDFQCHGQMYHAGDYIPGYGNKVFEKGQK